MIASGEREEKMKTQENSDQFGDVKIIKKVVRSVPGRRDLRLLNSVLPCEQETS